MTVGSITIRFRIVCYFGVPRVPLRASGRSPRQPRPPSCGASGIAAALPSSWHNGEAIRSPLRRRTLSEAPPNTMTESWHSRPPALPPTTVDVRGRRSSRAPPPALSRRNRLFLGTARGLRRRRNAPRDAPRSLPLYHPSPLRSARWPA